MFADNIILLWEYNVAGTGDFEIFLLPISKRDYFAVCVPKIILPFKLTGVITVDR